MEIKKNIEYFLSIFLFVIPVLSFLNKINLPQITEYEVYSIFISQSFFLIIIFFVSFILNLFFLKHKLNLKKFFLANSLFFFILLFFQNVKSFLFFEKQNMIFDEIFTLLFFIIIYLLIIFFLKKNSRFIYRFLIIFILLQFFYFVFNIISIKYNFENQIHKTSNFDISSLKANKQSGNIFFVILDGMMTLESAEKLKIINKKEFILRSFKKDKINYKKNFLVNYDSTYLSLASLLQGIYPVTENSKKYKTRKSFYPFFLLDQKKDNNFFKILRKTDKNFFWLGNSNISCQNNIYINCINQKNFSKFFSIASLFYVDSIYSYIFNYIPFKHVNKNESVNFLKSPENIFKQNNIYFLHILSPHPPYFFNKKCEIKKDLKDKDKEIEYYGYAYNCLLDITHRFMNKISKMNNENIIIVMGDHGWSFEDKIMKKNNIKDNRFKTFFSYKIPSRCEKLSIPNSIVNVVRFALNCNGNLKIKYLKDLQFKTYYEDHKNYGKVFLKK